MRRAARGTIASLAAALLTTAVPAHAGDKTTREAEARFEEGLSRVKNHDFEAARLSFAQAYAVLHRPKILWNLALAEEKTGRLVEALQHFRGVVDDPAAGADRTDAQRHVESLLALTGHIEVKAPPGAQISVDGASTYTAPLPLPIDVVAGRHVVDADVTIGPRSIPVEVAEGQVAHVSFVPNEGASSPSSLPAAATSPPPAEAPSSAPPPAPAPAPAPEQSTASTTSSARVITTASLGGAAVVAFGLGIYFGLESRSHASTVNSYVSQYTSSYCSSTSAGTSSTCSQWNDAYQAQNRDAVVSDIFYVTGGVLTAAAAATWLLWPHASHGTGAWVLPEVGPSSAGLKAGASF
jgi:hypothetical protein